MIMGKYVTDILTDNVIKYLFNSVSFYDKKSFLGNLLLRTYYAVLA